MSKGRLIAFVGPSGVGKDTVMAHLTTTVEGLHQAQRVITRASDRQGENHIPVSVNQFKAARDAGEYALHWEAHGLYYGVAHTSLTILDEGNDVLINLSRHIIREAAKKYSPFIVIHLTASRDVLARRLEDRDRENDANILARLNRPSDIIDPDLKAITIDNSRDIKVTVSTICSQLSLSQKDST